MAEPDGFHVEIVERGAEVRARLVGKLDAASLPVFLDAVEPLAATARHVALDCRDLAFCDSSGLRGIVVVRNALGAGGTVSIDHPSSGLRQILQITGLDALVDETDPTD